MRINVPAVFMSYYDIAIAANLELYNFVRKTAKGRPPTSSGDHRPVGTVSSPGDGEDDRGRADMGDARLTTGDCLRLLRPLPQGETSAVLDALPKLPIMSWD